jgi:hypothetical protein
VKRRLVVAENGSDLTHPIKLSAQPTAVKSQQ